MKNENIKEEKTSAAKDIIQGIIFLVIPVVIIYLIIKYF